MRYSKITEKYPHLRGKDLAMTQRSCDKFKELPVFTICRGTFRQKSKHQDSLSSIAQTRAGGIAFALSAMEKHIHELLMLQSVIPRCTHFLGFYCGRVKDDHVKIQPSC